MFLFGCLNFIINVKGDIIKFDIMKKDEDYKLNFKFLMKFSFFYLFLLGFIYYRGRILLFLVS